VHHAGSTFLATQLAQLIEFTPAHEIVAALALDHLLELLARVL